MMIFGKALTGVIMKNNYSEAEKKIIKAKVQLYKNVSFANILFPMNVVRDDRRANTMCTDGKNIFWNEAWVLEQDQDHIRTVILHEICHCVFGHFARIGDRSHKLWNIATDYAINSYICHELNEELPEGALLSWKFHNMSAEEIYKKLTDDDSAFRSMIFDLADSTGEEFSDIVQDSGNPDDPYEELPELEGEVISPTDEEGNDLPQKDVDQIQADLTRSLLMGEKFQGIGGGDTGFSKIVQSLSIGNVDWVAGISKFLQDSFGKEKSWRDLHRRYRHMGINLPRLMPKRNGGELAVAVDTSGSVSEEELAVYSAIIDMLCQQLNIKKVRVCYCHSSMVKNEDGEFWDIFNIEEGDEVNLVIRGSGGTKFDPVFNLIDSEHTDDPENISALIYFTDGYGDVSEHLEPTFPTLWAISSNGSESEDNLERHFRSDIPFGEFLPVNLNALKN